MVEKPWLAVFTCALGLAVVLDLFQNMCIVLFLAFGRYQQNHRQNHRFRSCLYKWGMASSAACECGAEQTVDHVVLHCPIHRPPTDYRA